MKLRRSVNKDRDLMERLKDEVERAVWIYAENDLVLDFDALLYNKLKFVWTELKDKYGTRYKMVSDVLDMQAMAEEIRSAFPSCTEVEENLRRRVIKIHTVKRTWFIRWYGDATVQTVFITPDDRWFSRDMKLIATYKVPQMLAELDIWIETLETMIKEKIEKARRAIAERKVNASTAKALASGVMGRDMKYLLSCSFEGLKLYVALHQGRKTVFSFPYEEMYRKFPLARKAVEDMNSLIDEFGPQAIPEGIDTFFDFWAK